MLTNEMEAEEKKQKKKELKEAQHKEYLEKLNSIYLEKEITKKNKSRKKRAIRLSNRKRFN